MIEADAGAARPPIDPTSGFAEITVSARDGLRLYGRHYRARGSRRMPVLCLAGLTRNSRDFHDLALALASGPEARPVYTMDSRGRGRSEWDKDWRNYVVPFEMLDVQDFMTACDIAQAAIVGTSRGGLVAMVLAVARPTAIGAVVLNDIGPVIERQGLVRIAGYVGRTPVPRDWDDAARIVEEAGRASFPRLQRADWMALARQWFNEADGRPVAGYDPKLIKSLSVSDEIPKLWPQFGALSAVPCLVVRGAVSDILSEATVGEMIARHPRCSTVTVADEGHAPLLKDAPTISAIAAFLGRVDQMSSGDQP